MPTFAHIENGFVIDPLAAADTATYKKILGDHGWNIIQVPDGTVHGAADAGGGTYTPPSDPKPPVKPDFRTLTGSDFIALVSGVVGLTRLDQLLAKSVTVHALLLKAEKIDRLSGNTPAALAFLKTGTDKLTDQELADIDAAWKTKG